MTVILNRNLFPSSTPTRAVRLQGSNCEAKDVPGQDQIRISTGYDQCNTSQQVGPTDTRPIGASRIVTMAMDRLCGSAWLSINIALTAKRKCTRKAAKQKRKKKMKKTEKTKKMKKTQHAQRTQKMEMEKEKQKKEAKND